jgi:hypothetical protein
MNGMTNHFNRPLSSRFIGLPEEELSDPKIGNIYAAGILYKEGVTNQVSALLKKNITSAFFHQNPDFNIDPDVSCTEVLNRNDAQKHPIGVDKVAWYRPARFHESHNKDNWYGIHFDKSKICGLALRIQEGNYEKGFKPSIDLNEKWLHAVLIKVYWHEVCHGWVEDLCSIAQTLVNTDYYTETAGRLGFYIKEEEALCNTSALSMVKHFYGAETSDEIEGLKQCMNNAPPGYCDYRRTQKMWPDDEVWIQGDKEWKAGFSGLMSLLINQYRMDPDVARYVISHFFGPSEFSFPKIKTAKFSKHGSFDYIGGDPYTAKEWLHKYPFFKYRDYPMHIH